MYTLKTSQATINQAISGLVFNSEPKELYDPIRYILSLEGKRLRPSLVLMACNLFSDNVEDAGNDFILLSLNCFWKVFIIYSYINKCLRKKCLKCLECLNKIRFIRKMSRYQLE